jgi:hypothetical protein
VSGPAGRYRRLLFRRSLPGLRKPRRLGRRLKLDLAQREPKLLRVKQLVELAFQLDPPDLGLDLRVEV